MEYEKENGVRVTVVNIKYGREFAYKQRNRPEMAMLDLPASIANSSGDRQKYYDAIETFAYNTLTKKFGAEVCNCQIYL